MPQMDRLMDTKRQPPFPLNRVTYSRQFPLGAEKRSAVARPGRNELG
jgi:hypothetical protein